MALAGEIMRYIGNEFVPMATKTASSSLSSVIPSAIAKTGAGMATKAATSALGNVTNKAISNAANKAVEKSVLQNIGGRIFQNGKPKSFYHGSPNPNIDKLDLSKAGSNTQSGENVLYFTDDYPTAEEFSYERLPSNSMFINNRGKKGKVYEKQLDLKNLVDLGNLSDEQIGNLYEYADAINRYDGKEKFIQRVKDDLLAGNDQSIKTRLDLNALKNSDYDGFIAKMYPNQKGLENVREYGVFNPDNVRDVRHIPVEESSSLSSIIPVKRKLYRGQQYSNTDFSYNSELMNENPDKWGSKDVGKGYHFTPKKDMAGSWEGSDGGVIEVDYTPDQVLKADDARKMIEEANKLLADDKYMAKLWQENEALAEQIEKIADGNLEALAKREGKPFVQHLKANDDELGTMYYYKDVDPELTDRFVSEFKQKANFQPGYKIPDTEAFEQVKKYLPKKPKYGLDEYGMGTIDLSGLNDQKQVSLRASVPENQASLFDQLDAPSEVKIRALNYLDKPINWADNNPAFNKLTPAQRQEFSDLAVKKLGNNPTSYDVNQLFDPFYKNARKENGLALFNSEENQGFLNKLGIKNYTSMKGTLANDGEHTYTLSNTTGLPHNEKITLNASVMEDMLKLQSVELHEAAHAAWLRLSQEQKVAIGQDLCNKLGLEANVGKRIANSTDLNELIAYSCEANFTSGNTVGSDGKFLDKVLSNSTAQRHLDNVAKMAGDVSPSFKERVMNVIRAFVDYIKAKIKGIRDIGSFDEFYDGLSSGDFAEDMATPIEKWSAPTKTASEQAKDELFNKLGALHKAREIPSEAFLSIDDMIRPENSIDDIMDYINQVYPDVAEKLANAGEQRASDIVYDMGLSPQQQEFFKDSVVRDENGELIPMYHGTRGDFTIFGDKYPSSSSNSHSGVGFWFTPSEEGAKNFANSIWYGDGKPKAMKTYLNIKNPKVYESVDNSKAVDLLRKKLSELEMKSRVSSKPKLYYKNMYDYAVAQNMVSQGNKEMAIKWLADKSSYDDKTATELIEEIDNLKKLADEKKKLQYEISELKYGDAYERFRTDIYKVDGQTAEDANVGGIGMALNDTKSVQKYVDNLKAQGYDGIIIKGTNYDADTMGGINDQYVAFYPEQIKNVDNKKPTKNKDIRYAIAAALGLGSIIGPYMNSQKSVDNEK